MSAPTRLPEGAWPSWHEFGRHVIAPIVIRSTMRLTVHHRERLPADGAVVMVANHSAMIDGAVMFYLPRRRAVFLVKNEFFRGFLGWYFRKIGQLPVRRGEPDRKPLMAAVQVLREGGLIGVFPEGTRTDGDVQTAHQGAVWLARTASAQILPVAVRGTRRPEGSRRRFLPRTHALIGEPMPAPTAKGKAGLTEATEEMRARLAELVVELDDLVGPGR